MSQMRQMGVFFFSFFDLPYDVRQKIYRRSRFLEARERIRIQTAGLRKAMEEHMVYSFYSSQAEPRVAHQSCMSFMLTGTKVMDIRKIPEWEELDVVVREYHVVLSLSVLEDGSVRAFMETKLWRQFTSAFPFHSSEYHDAASIGTLWYS